MGRSTKSDIIYYEQLGRGLSVRENYKEEYDKLYQKDIAELRVLCKEKNREIKDDMEKEEIIETLLAPIIIDLANNIDYIKELEDNLKDRVKEVRKQNNSKTKKRVIHLSTTDFNISMINQNLYEILKYVSDRLSMTWMEKYNLAKAYFNHYGDLEIPISFKTTNGHEYDENGIALGTWICRQRQAYKGQGTQKITPYQIKLLEEIGMRFENERWRKKYNLAKAYFEHYGNLEIPTIFKTTNGYEYDENGIALGTWIVNQRIAYKGNSASKITPAKINLLKEIGMRFENIDTMETWMEKYKLAKTYFEHYGNLEIPQGFKTINGYDYDENGIALGIWLAKQRQAYKGDSTNKITPTQIKLLEEIGMRFETANRNKIWIEKYNLAKAYFEHYGNLEIPTVFKTTNGHEYDENGIALGQWIANQRNAYKGTCRQKITPDQIKLLEEIGMKWFNNSIDNKFQKELITENNLKRKQTEIMNRFTSYLNHIDDQEIDKDTINQGFVYELNHKHMR